jgi:ABC-type Fe3+-hydroxamate transport system substrate-binding protein
VIELKDQTDSWVRLESYPKRIICLVPSITELLYDLGLEEEVVGITKFCIHPAAWFKTKTRVGGTKTVSLEKIAMLSPDLIIANKEENIKEQVETIAAKYPVYISDISNLGEALQMIADVGVLTGTATRAGELVDQIKSAFSRLKPQQPTIKTCYFIWRDPYITVGGDTFISDMLERCGFENIFKNQTRYPETSLKEILALNCKLLLLSSEPFPFKEKHLTSLQSEIASNTSPGIEGTLRIRLADGEFFSWYGSRLVNATRYFRQFQNLPGS